MMLLTDTGIFSAAQNSIAFMTLSKLPLIRIMSCDFAFAPSRLKQIPARCGFILEVKRGRIFSSKRNALLTRLNPIPWSAMRSKTRPNPGYRAGSPPVRQTFPMPTEEIASRMEAIKSASMCILGDFLSLRQWMQSKLQWFVRSMATLFSMRSCLWRRFRSIEGLFSRADASTDPHSFWTPFRGLKNHSSRKRFITAISGTTAIESVKNRRLM